MQNTIPNAVAGFVATQQERKTKRTIDKRTDVFMVAQNMGILISPEYEKVTRWDDQHGWLTKERNGAFAFACGDIGRLSDSGGMCSSREHGRDDRSRMICKNCARICVCGKRFCTAHVRWYPEEQVYRCRKCQIKTAILRVLLGVFGLAAMFFIEPSRVEETQQI